MVPAVGLAPTIATTAVLASMTSPPEQVSVGLVLLMSYDNWSWILFIFPVFLLLLVFPTGRLLSPRWLPLVWLLGVMTLVMIAAGTFSDTIGPVDESWSANNPIGFLPTEWFTVAFGVIWTAALLFLTVTGVFAIVLRYRRGNAVERSQLKWFLFAVSLFAVVYVILALASDWQVPVVLDILFALSIVLIPVSIVIAILRFHLFEIDRVISRTVAYALVLVLLGVVYAFGAIWLPTMLVGSDSPFFVAGSTLAVVALFNPSRRRVVAGVDRRFHRSHYDAERALEELSWRVRDEVDADRLGHDWLTTAAEAMQPTKAGVWVKQA
jgi:hypothetical protein